jgi:hypothetical protein
MNFYSKFKEGQVSRFEGERPIETYKSAKKPDERKGGGGGSRSKVQVDQKS